MEFAEALKERRAKKKEVNVKQRDRVLRKVIEWGIVGVVVFSPLPAASVYGWSILVIQLAVLVMVGAYVWMTQSPQNNPLLSQSMKWPRYLFLGFFGFLFLQVLPLPKFLVRILSPQTYSFHKNFSTDFSQVHFMSLSVVPSQTLQEGLEILAYVLLGFLIVHMVTRRKQILRLVGVLVGLGVFQALYGLFELYNPNPRILFYEKTHYLDCVTGTFVNRNHLSGYLEMMIPLAIGLVIARVDFFQWSGMKWKQKLLRISERGLAWNVLISLGIVGMALAIIYSKSRSGVFILVFTFLLFFGLAGLYFRKKGREKKGITNFLKVVFLVIVVISLYIGVGATLERFSLDKILREQRPLVWGNTVEVFSDFPLFGSGLGTFGSVYTAYEESGKFVRYSHAHNDYLEYLSELGIVGTVLFFGGILLMIVQSFLIWRERRHPQVKGVALGGIVAVVCILIHSITDFNLHIPANMVLFAVVLSLTMVTAFYKRNSKFKSQNSKR